jgi:hypothetical protein
MEIGLINIIVFSSDIKLVSFFLWKFQSIHSDHGLLILLRGLGLIEKVHVHLWVTQFTEMPLADFTVIRDRDDVMSILGSYNS